MADEGDDSVAPSRGHASAAQTIALGGASRAKADAFLDEQMRLARLQSDSLIEQNAFELSHLRWRRFNDQMKGALQIMVVALGLLVVVAIVAAMWNASRAAGLVVDAFSVPPALAQAGIGGDVVADDMTAKIAAVRDFANDNSLARSDDVREDRARAIKVEIPETGVSLDEAWRYLKLWLGHERHLSGNLRALPGGKIALTVTLGRADTFTFTGAASELDALEQKAAEQVFATVDSMNMVLYLGGKGRHAEALAAAAHNVDLAKTDTDRAEAYSLYANTLRYVTGDAPRALAYARLAVSLAPLQAPQHMEILGASLTLGHDEDVLAQARLIATMRLEDNVDAWRVGNGFNYVLQLGARYRLEETGDFAGLAVLPCVYLCSPGEAALQHAEAFARAHDIGAAANGVAQAQQLGGGSPSDLARAKYVIDSAKGDWRAALSDALAIADTYLADKDFSARFDSTLARTRAMPLVAQALAMVGAFREAHAAIDGTPADCYLCLRMRGAIDAIEHNWAGAAFWYARAASIAPSVPFAQAEWGAMLLRKGDPDAAIAHLVIASHLGPNFADPLELWGEALIATNRSDLALGKFEAAARAAPNWGRLHLKWGEALFWLGKKDDARAQFALAAALTLTPADRARLARFPG